MKQLFLIIAIVLFILSALGVTFAHPLEWGLAALAISFLPLPDRFE